jgi:hypothetical protein
MNDQAWWTNDFGFDWTIQIPALETELRQSFRRCIELSESIWRHMKAVG